MKLVKPVMMILLVISLIDCSSMRFLTKDDYRRSTALLEADDVEASLHSFPQGENGSFIPVMEKTYLNLLMGKPEIDTLAGFAKKIKKRVRFNVSREIKSFFYLETQDGYYVSEHEVIWMHMLLSWGYSLRGDYDRAYVEAKVSANLLRMEWSEEGHFDDPFMRIFLGTLWAMCGHWNEAQVDFRKAYELDPKLVWARRLGNLNKAPKDLIIVLGGAGRKPEWKPELKSNPFRGFRGIIFEDRGAKSEIISKDLYNRQISMFRTPDSSYWYKRHFIRDNEIQDLIQDSRYGQKVVVSTVRGAGIVTGGIVLGAAIVSASIAGSGAIIYWITTSGTADAGRAIAGTVLLGAMGVHYGISKGKETINIGITSTKKGYDVSNGYRFVRFLPEYAWVGWKMQKVSMPIRLFKEKSEILTLNSPVTAHKGIRIFTGFYPDKSVKPLSRQEKHKLELELIQAVSKGDADTSKIILSMDLSVNISNYFNDPLINLVIRNGNRPLVKHLLKKGARLEVADRLGFTPLHEMILARSGLEDIQMLIDKGGRINQPDIFGWLPIHHAVRLKRYDVVNLLLKKRSRLNVKTKLRFSKKYPADLTILAISGINGDKTMINLLKKSGAR